MKKIIIFLMFFFKAHSEEVWAWSYVYNVKASDYQKSNEILYEELDVPHFNQLIFSWNALRPEKGFFRFLIKARNAKTRKWSRWFTMIDWGKNIQKSYCIKSINKIHYLHVRLQMPITRSADAFVIKVQGHKGANLHDLCMVSACTSNFAKFKNETITNNLLNLPSIHIKGIPKKSQMKLNHIDNRKMCSPTSTCMLLSYLTKNYLNPVKFAKKVYDNGLGAYGSWPFNTAHSFEHCPNYTYRVTRLNSFIELYDSLTLGIPVVVSVRGRLISAPQDYDNGHLILVIGWDKKNKSVIVHDPAFDKDHKVEHKYKLKTFLRAWERSHRLSYIAQKR